MSREAADARLGRLLAIVPWIASHDGPTLDEVCRRFGVAERDLLADLNLLFMCGVYPFTPDVLIDVNIADGRVWINMADYFRRPLRLNPQEALALVAAGRAFLAVPGADPEGALATALDKLQTVLAVEPGALDDGLEVELGAVAPGVLDALRSAARDRTKVRIDYYSFGRDRYSTRLVHPWRVFSSGGQWYLSGWCETVAAERLFRLDRIVSLYATSERFELPPETTGVGRGAVYEPGPDEPVWVLDLKPPAHWIAEQYPNDSVEARPDGILRVRLRSSQTAWIERLLLRAGDQLEVVQGDVTLAGVAATRLLGRYEP
ncbi:MAG: WYL domain-containing protein [Acidimicrobiales bacterium]|nr:WYL domain-containing protein [Acidimicrobiales bacterium]